MTTSVPPLSERQLEAMEQYGPTEKHEAFPCLLAIARDHARLHSRLVELEADGPDHLTPTERRLVEAALNKATRAETHRDTLRAHNVELQDKLMQVYNDLNAISERLPEHPGPIRERTINELVSLRQQLDEAKGQRAGGQVADDSYGMRSALAALDEDQWK